MNFFSLLLYKSLFPVTYVFSPNLFLFPSIFSFYPPLSLSRLETPSSLRVRVSLKQSLRAQRRTVLRSVARQRQVRVGICPLFFPSSTCRPAPTMTSRQHAFTRPHHHYIDPHIVAVCCGALSFFSLYFTLFLLSNSLRLRSHSQCTNRCDS